MDALSAKSRVVGYVRVSTDEQAGSGVSLAAQAAKVRQYAELHELDLVELIEDPGVSAKSLDRPGLKRALAMLDSGHADGMVIAKLDRLTRSVSDLDSLIKWYFSEAGKRQLFSVADSINTRTAAGRMVLNILTTVAQWERETIVERTRTAMGHKRNLGERLGTIPYGFKLAEDGRALVPCPIERLNIGTIRDLRRAGCSFRRIAADLDASGVATRSGRPWAFSTVAKILGDPACAPRTSTATPAA